jgi:exodeoxyribonuclease VII large subunit
VRASTPTAAGRLVVPDLAELVARLDAARAGLGRGARRTLERDRQRVDLQHERLRRAPLLLVERKRAALEHAMGKLRVLSPRATLGRGYAIVRSNDAIVRTSAELAEGARVDVELAEGAFGARVEDTR